MGVGAYAGIRAAGLVGVGVGVGVGVYRRRHMSGVGLGGEGRRGEGTACWVGAGIEGKGAHEFEGR
jgi:hypothetical protein